MEIIIDLEYIKEIAAEKEDENWEFRSFLKNFDMPHRQIDAIVQRHVKEITAQIDCTKCANCCQQIRPTLNKKDITTFSSGLNIPVSEFQERYLSETDEPAIFGFDKLPCPFLKHDLCSNYDHRPESCRSYPHIHKKGFVSRLFGVVFNYEICPIVFNVYERLKDELWHDNERV